MRFQNMMATSQDVGIDEVVGLSALTHHGAE